MQPNNNMVNNTAPAPAPTPMTTPMNPGGDIVFKDKPKKKTGMIIGMVVLALLAAGGIGFGVWAYLDGNARVAKKDEQISNLQNQLAEQPEEEKIIIDEDTESDINTADYIYVGEWGLKIKIPSSLKTVSYDYTRNSNGPAVVVVGADYNGGSVPEGPIEDMGVIGLGSIQRYTKGAEIAPTSPPSLVFSDDNYDYYYHSPQMLYQFSSEEGKERQDKIIELVKEMFTTPDNYSKI